METKTNEDKNKQNLESQLEKYKNRLEEIKPKKQELGQKHSKFESEVKSLKKEVQKLETGYQGDEQAYEEYQNQLKEFDKFRFLRQKGSTQLANRFASVRIWGSDYLADRAMPRVFLRTFLTILTNFDTPDATKITNAFNNRTGTQALVANTGGANNPTPKSADWVVQEWKKYLNYRDKMIAIGKDSDIYY